MKSCERARIELVFLTVYRNEAVAISKEAIELFGLERKARTRWALLDTFGWKSSKPVLGDWRERLFLHPVLRIGLVLFAARFSAVVDQVLHHTN